MVDLRVRKGGKVNEVTGSPKGKGHDSGGVRKEARCQSGVNQRLGKWQEDAESQNLYPGGDRAGMGAPEESGQETGKEEAEDGGPGSGNIGHPDYRRGGGLAPGGGEKKAGLGERLRFIQDPTEGKNASRGPHQGPTGSKTHVENMNRERKQWGNLTTHQKVQGSAEQQKHMAKMKADVVKAAAKGGSRYRQENRQGKPALFLQRSHQCPEGSV